MNSISGLIRKKDNRSSMLHLIGFWLLLISSTSTADLQCQLAENSQIKPAVIATMSAAADKGYLYLVDTKISNIKFQANHFPFSSVEGHFNNFQGGLTMPVDADQPQQALFLIKVNSLDTGDAEVDDYIKSSVFFDAIQYPDIVFISTGFKWITETTARLFGELTLRGTTREIIFITHIDNNKNHSHSRSDKMIMMASAEIQRSEFGMQEMQLFISDTVHFDINIEASRIGN